MIKKALLFILIFISFQPYAQIVRLEIETKSPFDQHIVIPIKKRGALIFYETNANIDNAKTEKWIFSLYDTAFNEHWNFEYPLINNLNYIRHTLDQDFIYTLFTNEKEYEILKINIKTGTVGATTGRLKNSNYRIKDFIVIDNNAFWGGSNIENNNNVFLRSMIAYIIFPLAFIPNFIPGRQAAIIHSQLESKTTREILFKYKGVSEVSSIALDTFNQKVYAIIENNESIDLQDFKFNGIRNKTMAVKSFTKQYNLLKGGLNIINNKEKMIIGTFSKKNSKGSQGFFLSRFIDVKQDFIQYHSFTKMNKFFEYLDLRSKEKILKKIASKHKKGKDLTLGYQLVLHEPIEDSNQYIVVAEAYQAKYHTEFRTVWIYGRPVEQSYEVFDGWHYSHATIACFDNQGKLIWDNWISIFNITSFNLNEKVKVLKTEDKIILAYTNLGKVHTKVIKDGNSHEKIFMANADPEDITTANEEFSSGIDFWYGNYFMTYGIQEIKSKDSHYVKKNKNIFYINKIVFD